MCLSGESLYFCCDHVIRKGADQTRIRNRSSYTTDFRLKLAHFYSSLEIRIR